MEVDVVNWETLETIHQANCFGRVPNLALESELDPLFPPFEDSAILELLRQVHTVHTPGSALDPATKKRRGSDLQAQWQDWLAERDQLQFEIKRGREFLQQVQKELTLARKGLEDWANSERLNGRNPLLGYTQAIVVRERVEQFLAGWLATREERLKELRQEMEQYAQKHGLQKLL